MTASGAGSPARIGIERRRWTQCDAVVLAGLAILTVLVFRQVTILGRVFFFKDFGLFFYPKRAYAAEAMRHFQIPFWESYGGCGEPFLGAYQSAVFYPPALIYYSLPMPASFMWFVVFHFFLSGAGAYYMMRAWGARRAGAAFAAFAWAFCPAFISTVDNVSFQTSLAWLPWCLGFARRIYGGGGFGAFLWLAISFAMAVLAGAPEPVLFACGSVALFVLVQTVRIVAREGWGRAWPPAAAVAGALVLGAMLSGVELAPFAYTLSSSTRGAGLDMRTVGQWSASLSDAIVWFLPRFGPLREWGGVGWGGQFWLKTVYLGVLIPLLALWTTIFVRRRRNGFFIAMAVVFAALALGKNSFVWTFLYDAMPGFSLVRFPIKYYLPVALALSILAGFAVDDFSVLARRGKGGRRWALVIATIALAAVFAASWLVMSARRAQAPAASQGRQEVTSAQAVAAARYESTRWSFGRSASILLAGAAALVLAAYASRKPRLKPYGWTAVAAVVLADVVPFGASLNPTAPARLYTESPYRLAAVPHGVVNSRVHMTSALQIALYDTGVARTDNARSLAEFVAALEGPALSDEGRFLDWIHEAGAPAFTRPTDLDEWLKRHRGAFIASLDGEVARESFEPASNLLDRVAMPQSFELLGPERHYALLTRFNAGNLTEGRAGAVRRMWGVGSIVESTDALPGFAVTPCDPAASRAILVEHFAVVAGDAEALGLVTRTGVDLTRSVVLLAGDQAAAGAHLGPSGAVAPEPGEPSAGAARVVEDTGNRVVVETESARPTVLFLSDSWYGLIRARVDGASAPVWRANYAYRAVPVPAGRHVVQFVYQPLDFYAGVALTLAGAIMLVAAWAIRRRRGSCRVTGSN